MIRKSWMAAVLLPIRTARQIGVALGHLAGDSLLGLFQGLLGDPLLELADRPFVDLLGDLVLVHADQAGDEAAESSARLGGRADLGVDAVRLRGGGRQSRGPEERVDRELGRVQGRRRELVELRRPAALGIGGDLSLEIGDRRHAREQLAIVEGDAVVAGQESEAGLGAGGDLRPVTFAVDRSRGHQVLIEERRDDVDVRRHVEIGLVEQVVDRGLEVPRRLPGNLLVAGLERAEGLVDAIECGLALDHGRRAVVLGEGLTEVVLDEVDPALAVGDDGRVAARRQVTHGLDRAGARPRRGGPWDEATGVAPRGPGRPGARRPSRATGTSGRAGSAASGGPSSSVPGRIHASPTGGHRRRRSSPARWDPAEPPAAPSSRGSCRSSSPHPHSSEPPERPRRVLVAALSKTPARIPTAMRAVTSRCIRSLHRCVPAAG